MKFKYVGSPKLDPITGEEVEVHGYGVPLKNGSTLELEGHLANKALANPNYEQVKRGRPRKEVASASDQSGDS